VHARSGGQKSATGVHFVKVMAQAAQQEYFGKLIDFFTTEIGDINQGIHIRSCESLDEAHRAPRLNGRR
jgi:NIPSNAP